MVKMDYVWDRTTEFLGDHLSAVLPLAVIGILVPTSIMNALTPLWTEAGHGLGLMLMAVTIVAVVVLLWAYLAITALVVDSAARPRVAGIAARRLLPLIGIYLLLAAVFAVLFLPIGQLAAMSGMNLAAMQAGQPIKVTSPTMMWSLVLYSLAFTALLVLVMARLAPLGAVIVAERRGIGAIAQAWRLTRGMTLPLIGVAILYFVVSQVAGLAARTVFGSILRFVSPGDGPITVANIVTTIVVSAVSTVFTVLSTVFTAKLYVEVMRSIESVPAPVLTADSDATLP